MKVKTDVENIWITENPNSFKNKVKRYFSMEEEDGMNLIHYYKVDYASMSPEEKKYRIKYLWYKVKTVYNAVRFMMFLNTRNEVKLIEKEERSELHDKGVMIEGENEN